MSIDSLKSPEFETALLGGGCFWCLEAVFELIAGVEGVVSGYSGGNGQGVPSYAEVCSGNTGHAEVVQITFDPTQVSYAGILYMFMTSHDPTTLNRQGADIGSQYRSVIFYNSKAQQEIAAKVLAEMRSHYAEPIVTEISPLKVFHQAESEHQNYYEGNNDAPYCSMVITPKLAKFRELHAKKLKAGE